MSTDADKAFLGSIPQFYDAHLVPLIFEPYAIVLATRLVSGAPARILEIAAGTGALPRAMSSTIHQSTSIVATDLNQAMLDHAAAVGTKGPVEWRQADAMSLPFEDATF